MMTELKPCPFCGNHPAISDETTAEGIIVSVYCEYCSTHERDVTAYSTAWDFNEAEQDAIWKWNNRVYPPEISEAINHSIARKPMHQRNLFGEIKLGDCPACTAPVNEEFRFCGDCGQKLDWSEV